MLTTLNSPPLTRLITMLNTLNTATIAPHTMSFPAFSLRLLCLMPLIPAIIWQIPPTSVRINAAQYGNVRPDSAPSPAANTPSPPTRTPAMMENTAAMIIRIPVTFKNVCPFMVNPPVTINRMVCFYSFAGRLAPHSAQNVRLPFGIPRITPFQGLTWHKLLRQYSAPRSPALLHGCR